MFNGTWSAATASPPKPTETVIDMNFDVKAQHMAICVDPETDEQQLSFKFVVTASISQLLQQLLDFQKRDPNRVAKHGAQDIAAQIPMQGQPNMTWYNQQASGNTSLQPVSIPCAPSQPALPPIPQAQSQPPLQSLLQSPQQVGLRDSHFQSCSPQPQQPQQQPPRAPPPAPPHQFQQQLLQQLQQQQQQQGAAQALSAEGDAYFRAAAEELAAALQAEVEQRSAEVNNVHRRLDSLHGDIQVIADSGSKEQGSAVEADVAGSLQELAEGLALERASRQAQVMELRSRIVEELENRIGTAVEQVRIEVQQQLRAIVSELRVELQNHHSALSGAITMDAGGGDGGGGLLPMQHPTEYAEDTTPFGFGLAETTPVVPVPGSVAADAMSVGQGSLADDRWTLRDEPTNPQMLISEDLKDSLEQLVTKVNKTLHNGPGAGSIAAGGQAKGHASSVDLTPSPLAAQNLPPSAEDQAAAAAMATQATGAAAAVPAAPAPVATPPAQSAPTFATMFPPAAGAVASPLQPVMPVAAASAAIAPGVPLVMRRASGGPMVMKAANGAATPGSAAGAAPVGISLAAGGMRLASVAFPTGPAAAPGTPLMLATDRTIATGLERGGNGTSVTLPMAPVVPQQFTATAAPAAVSLAASPTSAASAAAAAMSALVPEEHPPLAGLDSREIFKKCLEDLRQENAALRAQQQDVTRDDLGGTVISMASHSPWPQTARESSPLRAVPGQQLVIIQPPHPRGRSPSPTIQRRELAAGSFVPVTTAVAAPPAMTMTARPASPVRQQL
mmetsp:Transcript_118551/g.298147  ORF Transcript_118551/g.298147 Transcript_118551/m.298147 type:complete len:787 (-) Transcript_118551:9-2369(-)